MAKKNVAMSVNAVFNNRNTTYYPHHPLFSGEMKNDYVKQIQWNAFLKKMKSKANLSFAEVVDFIAERMKPYWLSLNK